MPRQRAHEAVTIYTIAEAAGVHPSTASRALSPNAASRISVETAERVRRIAVELGYRPHPWAASLRTNRTHTIGVILPRLTDGVLAQMGEAAEDEAREHGYIAVTLSTRDNQGEQAHLAGLLVDRRVDGLILATPELDDPLLDVLEDRGVPFVLMNRRSGDHPAVSADDELGGYRATRHLLSQGHNRVGIVTGPLEFSTASYRFRGYRRALDEAGISIDDGLIVGSSFRMDGGVAAGTSLLGTLSRPSGVVAVNDSTAIGVMAAARELGLRVPEDVAVVGYNDSEVAANLPTPLSSVAIPLARIGRLAVNELLRRIDGEKPEPITVAPQLRVRASSRHRVRPSD